MYDDALEFLKWYASLVERNPPIYSIYEKDFEFLKDSLQQNELPLPDMILDADILNWELRRQNGWENPIKQRPLLGCYLFFDLEHRELIYAGRANYLYQRLVEHVFGSGRYHSISKFIVEWSESCWNNDEAWIPWVSIWFTHTKLEKVELESQLICRLQPTYNKIL